MIRDGETLWSVIRAERALMIGDLERKRGLHELRRSRAKTKRGWTGDALFASFVVGLRLRFGRGSHARAVDATT
jgi:hypothetical protein